MSPHNNIDKYSHELKQVSVFKGLSNDVVKKFTQKAQEKIFDKKYLIFTQDDNAQFFYIVLEGAVKLFRETRDGEECIIDVVTKNQIFADASIFNGNKHTYSAEAIKKTSVVSIPLSVLETALGQDANLSRNIMEKMALAERRHIRDAESSHNKTAAQRTGCFLISLCPENNKGSCQVELPYGKTVIASQLSMKPETFSRSLKTLEDDLGVTSKGKTVFVPSTEKLVSYTCALCSHTHPCSDLK